MTPDKQPAAATVPRTDDSADASLEDQLREAQKTAAIGTLAAGIARELNNAVATILGNVELARQDVGNYPPALESLNEIRKAGTRARALAQQMLSFSRRQPTTPKWTLLGPVMEESVHLLRATLPRRLSLELHCDPDIPAVLADATQIEQIVLNLAANAMQGMRSGPGNIGVRLDTVMLDATLAESHPALRTLHAKHAGRTIRLAVSDNGPGLDPVAIGKAFEHIVTATPADERAGLDLSEVSEIVQAHRGAIVADSQPGKVTTFTVYLPIVATRADTSATVPDAAPAHGIQNPCRHIIYIDDDDSLVFLVERFLERRGFRISGYVDQREALEALRANPDEFDLVVIDYNMPGTSGLQIAREIRAIRSDLTIAVASGAIDEVLRTEAKNAGVQELIFKVNEVENLCEAFARLARSVRKTSKVR